MWELCLDIKMHRFKHFPFFHTFLPNSLQTFLHFKIFCIEFFQKTTTTTKNPPINSPPPPPKKPSKYIPKKKEVRCFHASLIENQNLGMWFSHVHRNLCKLHFSGAFSDYVFCAHPRTIFFIFTHMHMQVRNKNPKQIFPLNNQFYKKV